MIFAAHGLKSGAHKAALLGYMGFHIFVSEVDREF